MGRRAHPHKRFYFKLNTLYYSNSLPPSPAVPHPIWLPHHTHTNWRGRDHSSLPAMSKNESTRQGGILPPCCVEKCESTWQGGLSPPCLIDSRGTRGPDLHGFGTHTTRKYPYPRPSKPVPMLTGTGFRRVQVLIELPVTGPMHGSRTHAMH